MALKTQNVLVVTASILIGTAMGEVIGIERWLDGYAMRVENRFRGSRFADGLSHQHCSSVLVRWQLSVRFRKV